jgi:hypothetical protein
VSKAEFEQLIYDSQQRFISSMADSNLAQLYNYDLHPDLPYMLTKNRGA